jgi:mRNA-degrading endonuclease RelE of RelBE toxin-antitoxin system
MSFEVNLSQTFVRNIKPLSKKYKSLADDLEALIDSLEVNPMQGTPLGKSCYKVRLAIKSKGKGKSGGPRRAAQGLLRM